MQRAAGRPHGQDVQTDLETDFRLSCCDEPPGAQGKTFV